MFETIVSLATPPLKSALAIIRLSGDDCFNVVSQCFSKDLASITKRTVFVGKIIDNNQTIDEVVLIAYKGPKSFTGEDMVEIISHGSMLIVNQIISILINKGARLATRGEYSSRAFLHQKVDLIQAEAINDVINATTIEAKKLSLMSLSGQTSKLIEPIKIKLADLLSLIEVNIDYPEYEDIEIANKSHIVECCNELLGTIDHLIVGGEKGQIVKDGVKVAIIGKPNVGKSSLLNALMGEDRAIVSDVCGTTRDIVEGEVNIGGITLHLLDTAGLRDSTDKIESIGIDKAKQTIEKADLVILVLDASQSLDTEDEKALKLSKDKKRVIVYNKSDLISKKDNDKLYISALNKDLEPLTNKIMKLFGISEEVFTNPSLNNSRQIGLLKHAKEQLLIAKQDALADMPIDLVSASIYAAYKDMLDILGEDNKVDISKEIFARFCVGK